MAYGRYFTIIIGLMALFFLAPRSGVAQERSYSVLPSPDAWYNRVDGFKVGVRLLGQVPGTFDGGPHRLRSVVWLGTSIPNYPIGYELEFTEPIKAFSEYGSEATWSLISGIRSGYYRHGMRVMKRWQPGFDERFYRELQLQSSVSKRFDVDYAVLEQRWSREQTWNTELRWTDSGKNRFGPSRIGVSASAQWLGTAFFQVEADVRQSVRLGRAGRLLGRVFGGLITSDRYPEYLYLRSGGPAVDWMQSRFTEARGTIPPKWIRDGLVHVSSGSIGMGPSLRGAAEQEMQRLRDGDLSGLMQSVLVFHLEYSFINPIQNYIDRSGYLGEFLGFETYLFGDTGGALLARDRERDRDMDLGLDMGTDLGLDMDLGPDPGKWLSSAGFGALLRLSFPGPDLKTRSLVLRYEIPAWLSDGPGPDHKDIDFRQIVGIGAVIPF